jgi:hypothetical protein
MSKRLNKSRRNKSRRNKSRRNKSRRNNKSRRHKSMKGGTGFRAPQGVNFVPFSNSSYSFIQDVPLNNALGAASR